jgi:type IX secretion system substrate protein
MLYFLGDNTQPRDRFNYRRQSSNNYQAFSVMKSFVTILTVLTGMIIIGNVSAQPICDFQTYQSTPTLSWYDNNGSLYTTWAANSNNWDIINTSSIGNPVGFPYVLHTNPGKGNGGQSPQWLISAPMTGFEWQYNELQWTFWWGRRANNGQNGGNRDRSTVWLYINRAIDIDNLTGLEGIRLTWHHNNNKDNIQLVEVHGGVEYVLADTVFLDNLANYEWGSTIRVNRIPTGTPTGSQVRWTLYTSTPSPSFANFSSYSIGADSDPSAASVYKRFDTTLAAIDTWIPTSTTGRLGFMSDFAGSRRDAAEYNQLCLTDLGPTPVELTSFDASYRNDQVFLNWNTATEISNYGFEVERSVENTGKWESIGFVEGFGNSNSPRDYSFVDMPNFDGATQYAYRLKQIDFDGAYEYSNTVVVTIAPTSADVLYNFPNPFNPTTNISFNLQTDDIVSLSVFNASGQKVADIYEDEKLSAGYYTASFNGSDLPSGTYFYRLSTSDATTMNSMVLSK